MSWRHFILVAALSSSFALGQEPEKASPAPAWQKALESAKTDLEQSLTKLRQTRAKIAEEKPALATEFESVRSELLSKRRQADLARMSREDRNAALADDRRTLNQLRQDLNYSSGIIGDLPQQLKTRANAVELPRLESQLPSLPNSAAPPSERLQAQREIIDSSLNRLDQLLGGQVIEGSAIDATGQELTGQVALLGPIAIFSSTDQGGQLYDTADLIPKLGNAGDTSAAAQLVAGQEAQIQLDLTGGAATALSDLDSGPLELIKKGGAWVYPILLIALISAICGLVKFMQLSAIRTPREGWVAGILRSLRDNQLDDAIEQANQAKHPAGTVLSKALESSDAGADVVEEVIYESMIGVQARLQKWLPFIAITAATAPLLGLLGTVSGMIRTFNVIQIFGSGDPKPLAGGISEALITTLFGLVVAIPALILHAMLSRRCQGIQQTTEQLGLTLVNGLRRDENKRK